MVDGDKKFGVVLYVEVGGMGEFSHRECLYFFTSVGLHFVRFLKQILGYTALDYA